MYLGLGNPDKFDRSAVERWLTLELEQALPLRPDLRTAIERHSQALFETWPGPQSLNQNVITAARRALVSVPPVDQLY